MRQLSQHGDELEPNWRGREKRRGAWMIAAEARSGEPAHRRPKCRVVRPLDIRGSPTTWARCGCSQRARGPQRSQRCVQSVNPKFFPAVVVAATGKLVP